MSSLGVSGVGTEFRYWDTTEEAWTKLAEVTSITGPSKSRESIDVTSLDTTGGYREFIGSFRDGGTVTLAMVFRRDTYEVMNDHFESSDNQNYEIVLPDAENTTLEFEGLVQELPLTISPDDKISVDVTIKVSGQPTLNSGSASASPG